MGDLGKVGPGGQGVTVAGPVEFQTRQTGLVGMKEAYNLPNLGFLPAQAGSQYQAIDQGSAQAADAFSTDYQLLGGKYTPLSDPKGVFGFQYVAPVVKQATLQAQGPEFQQTLNWVSSLLSTQAIQAMNQQVQGNGADPAAVAAQFLQANGVDSRSERDERPGSPWVGARAARRASGVLGAASDAAGRAWCAFLRGGSGRRPDGPP